MSKTIIKITSMLLFLIIIQIIAINMLFDHLNEVAYIIIFTMSILDFIIIGSIKRHWDKLKE